MLGFAMMVTAGCFLSGCSTLGSMNPINWWHRQEGGKIAEQRPPPPGADQPYPNLSTVPPKPDAPDAETLRKLTAALVADRTNAQHAAQSVPLADPSSPSASPNLFGVGTAPPPPPAAPRDASIASASIPAVTAPPAPAAPPPPAAPPLSPAAAAPVATPAPRSTVQSAPLQTPPAANQAAPAPAPGGAAAGPLPALPEGAPARPAVAGAPPPAPVAPSTMPASSAAASATIVFPELTTDLSQPAAEEVKAFAAKRGNGTISVTGYGDTPSSDPSAQSAALTLGLSRAQSIVAALKAAGVPGNAIRVSAEASGRGASLQLLQ
jgi:outer membrane protein OmpA-like peptidoglycan-associated protein